MINQVKLKKFLDEFSIFWFLTAHNIKVMMLAIPYIIVFLIPINLLLEDQIAADVIKNCLLSPESCQATVKMAQICNLKHDYLYLLIHNFWGTETKYFLVVYSFFVCVSSVAMSHVGFINNYIPKKFNFNVPASNFKNFIFIFILLLINIPFNFFMIFLFNIQTFKMKLISIYFIQNLLWYTMIKFKIFGYEIQKQVIY